MVREAEAKNRIGILAKWSIIKEYYHEENEGFWR